MPVNYKIIRRINPREPGKPGKYYAAPVKMKKMTIHDIGIEIGKRSTLKMPVVVGVLEALAGLMPELLSNGNILDLGNVGSFRLTFSSDGVDKPEDLKKSHIKKVKVQYRQAMAIKHAIKTITFKKMIYPKKNLFFLNKYFVFETKFHTLAP